MRIWRRTSSIVCLCLLLLVLSGITACRHLPQAPQITLMGRVVDAIRGHPLPGATLHLGRLQIQTDPAGAFAVLLAEGAHSLLVSHPGYVSVQTEAVIAQSASPSEMVIALEPRVLEGVVVDGPSGGPLAGAQVRLGDQAAAADEEGRFRLEAPAHAALEAAAPRYEGLALDAQDVEAHFGADGVLLHKAHLALAPRVLSGVVREEGSGIVLEGVRVWAEGTTEAYTDAEGRYTLAYVEEGSLLSFFHEDLRPYQAAYLGGEAFEATLSPYRLEVTVVEAATGNPLAGATLQADDLLAETDAQGLATLTLAPGHTITILHEGYRPVSLAYEGDEALQVALEPEILEGRVTAAGTGQPIAGAAVQVLRDDATTVLRTDAEGSWRLESAEGVQGVRVRAPGYGVVTFDGRGPYEMSLNPFVFRGIYIPFGLLSLPDRIIALLDMVQEAGLNGVVVDVKSDRGRLAWPSPHPVAQEANVYLPGMMSLEQFLEECRQRDIYAVARMVIFKDHPVAEVRPEWAVRRANGALYIDNESLAWTDPFLAEVQEYNIALALEIVALGFDEVQLDYVRFPSDGSTAGLVYSEEVTMETRVQAIAGFCAAMYRALETTPAFLSADIFGLTPWVSTTSDMGIGQRVEEIATHMDYISPMLYPTTFTRGNLGYDEPARHPYEVVFRSVKATRERTPTLVRPWLQHYSIGGYAYGTWEYLLQRKGADDAGAAGWIFWHAGGRYGAEALRGDAYADYPELPSAPQIP